ncbi:hypothetical protein K491DRAFT_614145 [Lophiostoma macrostomum CBS 122681]|uniref:Uncharacterized protein n=1 Tax=Lophiostoma macrostomum CBS 122681 TaxID=1314788 RepID=A0A6A6SIZ3_9PLEO|nr:hypothetical protein K491DRAFT_614145 [Lophiostoma macrostomum CBS 122681]
MSICSRTLVDEARAAAGHSLEQWHRFYFVTKDEAIQLSKAYPDWQRWIHIPANKKEEMLARINRHLAAEGIPMVEMSILKWRMSQLMRSIPRNPCKSDR